MSSCHDGEGGHNQGRAGLGQVHVCQGASQHREHVAVLWNAATRLLVEYLHP